MYLPSLQWKDIDSTLTAYISLCLVMHLNFVVLPLTIITHLLQAPSPVPQISELQCKDTPLQAPFPVPQSPNPSANTRHSRPPLLYPKSPNSSAKSPHSRPPVPYPNLPNCPCKSRNSSPLYSSVHNFPRTGPAGPRPARTGYRF